MIHGGLMEGLGASMAWLVPGWPSESQVGLVSHRLAWLVPGWPG